MHDSEIIKLLRRIHAEGEVTCLELEDPEETIPGITQAVKVGLVRKNIGGGWSATVGFSLTRAGLGLIGISTPKPSLFRRLFSG